MSVIENPVEAVAERQARREELEAELKALSGQITAAQARFASVLGEYDDLEGWAEWGSRSATEWLSNHCGHGRALAKAELALAHALPRLPLLRQAMETCCPSTRPGPWPC